VNATDVLTFVGDALPCGDAAGVGPLTPPPPQPWTTSAAMIAASLPFLIATLNLSRR
jgi:hypothetical protein